MNAHSHFTFKDFIKNAPEQSGVYQMLDAKKKVLYVGKAKNLKNRLSSYLTSNHPKIIKLLSLIADIHLTACLSEEMALRVESSLIQTLQPPFNVLLKDDKSFPFICLSKHLSPALFIDRKKTNNDALFRHGPYPSLKLANEVFRWILKKYQLRTCSDFVFKARSRPCLEHQIGHCQAPCVYKDQQATQKYADSVSNCILFLNSPMQEKLENLQASMIKASEQEDFEKAAYHRDLIRKLHAMQRRVGAYHSNEYQRFDVIAVWMKKAHYFVVINNEIESSETFSVSNPLDLCFSELIETIVRQRMYYLDPAWIPQQIICDTTQQIVFQIKEKDILLRHPHSDQEKRFLAMAQESLLANRKTIQNKNALEYDEQFSLLEKLFLESGWDSIECADISHFQGQHTVGAVVRFHRYGPEKKLYRLYKIAKHKKNQNNDPLSMEEMLFRHLKKRSTENLIANVLVVDGGQLQLRAAYSAIQALQLKKMPIILAITKNPSRKRGEETYLFCHDDGTIHPLELCSQSYEALLLQEIRDEAHRSAGNFRQRLTKKSLLSHPFDAFKGINSEKKRDILKHFGGWTGLSAATQEQIQALPFLGAKTKTKLWDFLTQSFID